MVWCGVVCCAGVITQGRQEDAEEFLGFLLDGLHEEFIRGSAKMRGAGELILA